MVVEVRLIFIKTFKVCHCQNDDLLGMHLCPVIYHPENSLNKPQGLLHISIISDTLYLALIE